MIIDANIGLGRFANGVGADFAQTEKAIQHLKTAGIKKALVYSVLSREAHAEEGNAIVLEECKKYPELIPSWVISPYEMDIDPTLARMRKHGIRAARFFPERGHFSVYPSCIAPVVEKLQNANIVLFIDFEPKHWSSHAINYDAVYQLCCVCKKIPVVLTGSTITGARNYPNLLEKCKNLYLEISQMFQPEEVYHLVKKGFGQRLIFGSGFPLGAPGALLNMLAYCGLSQDELKKICSGNLLRLLSLKYKQDLFALKAPPTPEIIDLHVHHGKQHPVPSKTETTEGIIRNMNRCGIKAAMLTSVWACYGEVKRGNKAVSKASARFPGRLYGYLTLDPKYPQEIQTEIKLYDANPAFRGIKLHCGLHGIEITSPKYAPILAYANKKSWPVLCHAGVAPAQWEKICAVYKNAKFIVAHAGGADGTDENYFRLAELTQKHKNLYLDLAASCITPGILKKITARAGAKQVTFGSDYPMFDFAYETGRVITSSLTEKEKKMILCANAKKLLRL